MDAHALRRLARGLAAAVGRVSRCAPVRRALRVGGHLKNGVAGI
jgi:hypothetical protein